MFKRFSLLAKEHYIFLSEFVQKLHPKWNNTRGDHTWAYWSLGKNPEKHTKFT